MAWVVNGMVRELALVHEAMRRSLAAHLQADFDAERIFDRLDIDQAGGTR
jgi:hypothetical protein